VLSADNVGVKRCVVLTTQIDDAAKSVQAVDSHVAHIYSATQSTAFTVVAKRYSPSAQLRECITSRAEAVGVQGHGGEVMLPAELLKAKKEGPRSSAPTLCAVQNKTTPIVWMREYVRRWVHVGEHLIERPERSTRLGRNIIGDKRGDNVTNLLGSRFTHPPLTLLQGLCWTHPPCDMALLER
jgi:hypothetical protein